MKKILYTLFCLCSLCMLSACEIDDDCLDDDIRRKFEQERRGDIQRPGGEDSEDDYASVVQVVTHGSCVRGTLVFA